MQYAEVICAAPSYLERYGEPTTRMIFTITTAYG